MRILILGGTIFLGRHLAELAVGRGHAVSLFHRGLHGADLLPQAEHLLGDRDQGRLETLHGRSWDAVLDTSAYFPEMVRESAELLAPSVPHYVFVSSISVYADFPVEGMNEDSPLARLTDEQRERARELRAHGPVRAAQLGELYGGLKALCEQEARRALPGKTLVVRPGLIVGPWDYSDRFTYWVRRCRRDGDILCPGEPGRQVQLIDVRDLAGWMLDLVEHRVTGTFQATGPERRLCMDEMLDACAAGSPPALARRVWVSDAFLTDAGMAPWSGLPLWMPREPDHVGFMSVDCSRALAAGLRFRPLGRTAADTAEWDRTRPPGDSLKAGLDPERERKLLEAWTRSSEAR